MAFWPVTSSFSIERAFKWNVAKSLRMLYLIDKAGLMSNVTNGFLMVPDSRECAIKPR